MSEAAVFEHDYSPPVYFSDVFKVSPEIVDAYGAFDIALVNDLPLFVDPFLLFDSEDEKYRALHDDIIEYLVFLKNRAVSGELSDTTIQQWLRQQAVGFESHVAPVRSLGDLTQAFAAV
jgi:hypothetical protein